MFLVNDYVLNDSELEIPSVKSSPQTAPARLVGNIPAAPALYADNSSPPPLRSSPPRNSRPRSVGTPPLEYRDGLPRGAANPGYDSGPEDDDSALPVAAVLHDSPPSPNPPTPRVTTSPRVTTPRPVTTPNPITTMPAVPVVSSPPITEAITATPPMIMPHPTTPRTVVATPPVAATLSATVTPTTAVSPVIMPHPITTPRPVVAMPPAAATPPLLVAATLSATVTPTTATSPVIMTPDRPDPPTQSSTPSALMVPPVSSDWPKHMLDAYQYLTTETELTEDGTITTARNWGDKWFACLGLFIEFQQLAGFPDLGPSFPPATNLRPPEISKWMKNGRQPKEMDITDTEKFGQRWRNWWHSLQPKSRVSDKRSSAQPMSNMDWSQLRKPSKNGFLLIMVSLMWWGKGSDQDTDWMHAVADVTAVLSCINNSVKSLEPTIPQTAQTIANPGRPQRSLKRSDRGEYADKARVMSQKRHKK